MQKPFNVGYTTGKFMPLSQGHELLLSTAAGTCNKLIVHMTSDDADRWHIDTRVKWVYNFFRAHYPDVEIVVEVFNEIDYGAEKDENGTIVDPTYWDKWYAQIQKIFDRHGICKFDCVVTSDAYGKDIAEITDAKWVPVDMERKQFPISATKIRANPVQFAHLISPFALQDVAFKIAVIGPESVGKSTLINTIRERTEWLTIDEWGRTIFEANNGVLDVELFWSILHTQHTLVQQGARRSPVVVTDTEALVTANFFEHWFPGHRGAVRFRQQAEKFAKEYDLYIVLAPTVPFVQDGTRDEDVDFRSKTYLKLVYDLERLNLPFIIVDQTEYEARVDYAIQSIQNFVERKSIMG